MDDKTRAFQEEAIVIDGLNISRWGDRQNVQGQGELYSISFWGGLRS